MDQNHIDQNITDQNITEQKPKRTFAKGMGIGALIGAVSSLVIAAVAIVIYVKVTHSYIAIGVGDLSVVQNKDEQGLIDEKTAFKISEISSYIDLYYTGEYTADQERDGMLHGLVNSLGDPYAAYFNETEYKDFMVSNTGEYAGIGATLSQDKETKEVTIVKVYEGTPAEEAGLKAGDQIVTVGEIDSTTKELSDLVSQIRGEEGTKVTLTVYRKSDDSTFTIEVERKNIVLPSVEYSMLDNKIGYIQISQFQSDTDEQFDKALEDLEKQGMEKMIIDLRDNPGGLLDSVVNICDRILPEGTIVYTEDKMGKKVTYSSDKKCIDYPMVVLVNGNSASASEIFAGAIKDYEYGTLIGTKTFGKGIVQSIFNLSNGDGLKITTANYFTPKGNFIHKVGIEPDIELEYKFLGKEGDTYDKTLDNQLIRAQEYLTKGK